MYEFSCILKRSYAQFKLHINNKIEYQKKMGDYGKSLVIKKWRKLRNIQQSLEFT